jgi:RND family efflux transporter MFP subunit
MPYPLCLGQPPMPSVKHLLLIVLLLAAAAGGWYLQRAPQGAGDTSEAQADGSRAGRANGARIPGLAGPGGALSVITSPVAVDAGGDTALAIGTAQAAQSVALYPQVTGIVSAILFAPGQAVAKGAPLLRLEDEEEQVAVERAGIALDQARETLTRQQALAKSKTISDVTLREAETAARLAEVELRSAEIALARRTIAAPFPGTIGLTDLSVGDLVTTSTVIATLDDVSTLKVAFELPERWVGRVAPDQPISATAQGFPGADFAGRISGIDSRVDETTRTLKVEAELANDKGELKPGMAITVSLHFEGAPQLSVPSLAVQWDRKGSYVWKVAEGSARRTSVAIVRRESGVVIVAGDVAEGDRIVVEGLQRLREGAKVAEVGEMPAAAEGAGATALPARDPAAPARG